MKGIPLGKYTKEFREEAVKLVTEGNMSLPKAARSLLLPTSTLGNWVAAYKAGKLGEVGKAQRPLTEIEMELARTKRELVETRIECDLDEHGIHAGISRIRRIRKKLGIRC